MTFSRVQREIVRSVQTTFISFSEMFYCLRGMLTNYWEHDVVGSLGIFASWHGEGRAGERTRDLRQCETWKKYERVEKYLEKLAMLERIWRKNFFRRLFITFGTLEVFSIHIERSLQGPVWLSSPPNLTPFIRLLNINDFLPASRV